VSHEVLLAAAFSAGIVVVFSPCATALLPAYLSYYLAREQANGSVEETEPLWPRGLKLGLLAIALGLGILVFVLVDRVVTFGERALLDGALAVAGGVLAAIGAWRVHEERTRLDSLAFTRLRSQLSRGFLFGGAAALGIGTVYMAMGFAVRVGFAGLGAYLPWIAFGTALVVVGLGVSMLLGMPILSFTVRVRGSRGRTVPAYFLFGAGYGLIASGCFLPIFLQVIAASLALDLAEAFQVLLAYALGSAAIFLLLSVSAAAARGAALRTLRTFRRHVHRVAGAIVVATGAYVLWYDWTFLLSQGL